MNTPTKPYLLIRQPGRVCEVVLIESDGSEVVQFSGGRWPARRYMRDLREIPESAGIPQYCQKKGRRGHPGGLVAIRWNETRV